MSRSAVILLSGGLDSVTTMFVARSEGFAVSCLSFDYGQRHRFELECAVEQARRADAAEHVTVRIEPSLFRGTALVTGNNMAVPENRAELLAGQPEKEIPVTYVPARNMLFLSYGLAFAESIGARHIFIGANALDYSGYPDCRPEFLSSFEATANLGTKAGIGGDRFSVVAPLIHLSKSEIIRRGIALGVDFARTSSCYQPSPEGRPCGCCDSCLLRQKGFASLGVKDPLSGL